MKIEVKNLQGKGVGSFDLDDAVFGADVNEHLLWEAVKWQLAKRRAGTASTKRIGEVRGSPRRSGSRRAPARRARAAAGAALGRRRLGVRSQAAQLRVRMPRKVKKAALRSALSLRASEQKIVVLDNFSTDGKTKSVATALAALGVAQPTQGADRRRQGQRAARRAARATCARRSGSRPRAQRLRHPAPRDAGPDAGRREQVDDALAEGRAQEATRSPANSIDRQDARCSREELRASRETGCLHAVGPRKARAYAQNVVFEVAR
jgi:large subunit ribosomal protein L4